MLRRDSSIALGVSVLAVTILWMCAWWLAEGRYSVAGDAHYIYMAARSLALDGDLDLANQYREFGDRYRLGPPLRASDASVLPPRELGPSLLMAPGIVLAELLGLGERWTPAAACTLAAASIGVVAWFGARAAAARTRREHVVAALALAASVVPFYAFGRAGYAHAPDALACAALTWALLERKAAWLVGLCLAAAIAMRLQNGLWLLWPLVEVLRSESSERSRALARVGVIGALATLGLAGQAWLSVAHPGSELGAVRWGLSFFDFEAYPLDVLRVLAGERGLLTWSPIFALGGWAWWTSEDQRMRSSRIPAAVLVVAMVALMAAAPDVLGGDAFGARRLAGLAPLALVGTVDAVRRHPRLLGAVGALAALNVALTLLALAGVLSLRTA